MKRSATMPILQVRMTAMSVEEEGLSEGVCGRVTGVAVRYDVIDAYGTRFLRGCMDKTREKVRSGKVKLFVNHGFGDGYGTDTHVGVIRSLDAVGDGEAMVADLFDTEAGRKQKEYVRAVMLAGGETGLSIGFFERSGNWARSGDRDVYDFSEIELDEISLAPRNAVPGSTVTGVRSVSRETLEALLSQAARQLTRADMDTMLTRLYNKSEDDSSSQDAPPAAPRHGGDEPREVTMDDRLMAYRRSLTLTS